MSTPEYVIGQSSSIKSVQDSPKTNLLIINNDQAKELKQAIWIAGRYTKLKLIMQQKYKLNSMLLKSIERLEANRIKTFLVRNKSMVLTIRIINSNN